jgi:hypothetical protein
MKKPFLTLFIAFSFGISAFANPTPPAEVDSLIHDKLFASNQIQKFLDAIYKSGNTQLVDNSLFSTYSSGDHRYLIAKAYITFYNENVRQQVRGILLDVDSGWTFFITPEQPVHRLISRRHTVGFKRVWMRGASEERIRCDT